MPRRHDSSVDSARLDKAFEWVWSLTVITVPLFYISGSLSPFYHPKLLLLQIGLLLTLVTWGLRARLLARAVLPRSPIILPALAFLALSAASVFQAGNPFEATAQLGHRVTVVLFGLAVLCNARHDRLPQLLRPVVLACAATAGLGIAQYAGLGFLDLPTFGLPSATLGYRNFAAMYIICCVPLAFYLLTQSRRPAARGLWFGSLLLMLTLLICTRSRGAWLGLSAAGIAVGLTALAARLKGRRPLLGLHPAASLLVVALAAAIGFSALVNPRMGSRGLGAHSPEKAGLGDSIGSALSAGADKGRRAMWVNTWDMIKDDPLTGVGIGNWQFVYPAYDRGGVIWRGATPRRPHNDYLWMAAQIGIPGLIAFLWVAWVGLIGALRCASRVSSEHGFWLPACLGASVAAVLVHAAFSFPSERIPPSMLFWATLGLIALHDASWVPAGRGRRGAGHRLLPVAVVAVIVAVIVMVMLCIWVTGSALAFYKHFARSDAYLDQGQWPGVLSETGAALEYGPFDPQAYLQRGLAHYSLGNYDAAVRDNQTCLQYHPNLANALNNLGMALNAAGKYKQSLATLERLRRLAPEHEEAHANTGMALEGLGRYGKAVEAYGRYLHNRPDNAGIRHRLGAAYLQLGRRDSALTCFRQVLELTPGHLPAQIALGETLVQSGDTSAAVASYDAFLRGERKAPDAAGLVRRRLAELLGEGSGIGQENR